MTALLALALAGAPGCPEALAAAARFESPRALGVEATAIAALLVERGAGGPAAALGAEADAFADAALASEGDLEALAERFRARLARHCALAAERPGGPALRPGDRRALDEILARAEFQRARSDPGALARWLAELWRRILDLLGTEEAGRYATGGRTAFFAAVALALAAGLAWAVRRRRAPEGGERAPAPVATPTLPAPDQTEALARAALAAGRWAEAVRQAFLALLGVLERQGRVPRGRSLTNRELASHLAATAPRLPAALAPGFADLAPGFADLAPGFADLAARFDLAIYGGARVAAGEAAAFLDRARNLWTLSEAAP